MNEEPRLREAYGELLAARAPSDRAACPPAEALLALVERSADEATRLATLDHVMSCSACRHELDLLLAATAAAAAASAELPAASAAPAVDRPRGRRGWGGVPLRPLAMAAGIIVVIGVGVVVRDPGAPRTPTLRGGVPLLPLGPVARATDGRLLLHWGRVADATRYRVEIFAPSGATVMEEIAADTSIAAPATVLGASGEPGALRWMVTALRADGSELRSAVGQIER